jgi:hypothetical protein
MLHSIGYKSRKDGMGKLERFDVGLQGYNY